MLAMELSRILRESVASVMGFLATHNKAGCARNPGAERLRVPTDAEGPARSGGATSRLLLGAARE